MNDPIQNLRDNYALVALPRGGSADELIQQIKRIGCNFEHHWPLTKKLPDKYDMVFIDVIDQSVSSLKAFISSRSKSLSVVAVVGYENPSILDLVFEIGAHAILNKPVRASGVLSSMLMARRFQQEQLNFAKELKKLKDKLDNVQKVNDAKFVLMRHRDISEKAAYELIRKQAMAKRTTTAEISQAIINAESILSDLGDT